MKQVYKSCLVFLIAISAYGILLTGCQHKAETIGEEEDEMYDGPDKAAQFQFNRTKNPSTGQVPSEKMWDAVLQTQQIKDLQANSQNIVSALSWIERGSNSDVVGPSNGNTRANSGITSGRIDAMMVDSLDPTHKTVWVGGRDGGLWKTTDITIAPSPWTLVNDYFGNLSISAITQDPTNYNTMYFCTGESYFEGGAVRGNGVFKSTDHGVTWSQLSSTTTYYYCTRILCDFQGNVYLATRGNGLLRSTNGGTSWTNITPTGLSTNICDLEITSTAVASRLHMVAGIFSTQAYRYTDIAATATSSTGWVAPTTPFPTYNMRAEIGVSGNTLYAAPANASYQVPTMYKSIDGGDNWTATTGQPTSGWASGQGWYALTVNINPSDPNQCIVGGLDNFKTTDGGASWTKISAWVGTAGQYVHADQHKALWYDGGNKLIFGCDGGIHYSSDGGVVIRDRNEGLRLKQFYAVAIHPVTTNYYLTGAQDNGTHQFNNPGLSGSIEVFGGDGAYVAIDQNEPLFQTGAYVYANFRRSANGGASWSFGPSNNTGQFIDPYDYDNLGNKVYAGTTAGQYLRWEDPQSGFTYTNIAIPNFNGSSVTSAYVSPYTANRVYFGTAGGRIVKVDNANTATPTDVNITGAGMSGYQNCVVAGSDEQHLMACFSSYGVTNVWSSIDGGATWTGVDGNLPDMPVYWALYHPDDNTKAYIATETGVWSTDLLNGASTVWVPESSFPTVRCDMLKYRSSDRTIAAATYGRGLWTATIPSGCTSASITSQPANATICATNNATFSIAGTGTGYQWQVSINGGGSWTDVANGGVYGGATTISLTITGATAGMNGYQYRCVATGSCAPTSATSNAGILTVNAATSITSQPGASAICAGANTSFTVAATGASLTYQWQESTNGGGTWGNILNGGIYSGAGGVTLTLTGVTAVMNNNQYRCVIGSACTPLNSNAAILTVNAAPSVTAQPLNSSVCAGNTATFSVTGAGGGLTYQWQESTNGGGTWNNLANGAPYSGVLTATLSINPTTIGMNTYQYRCVISGSCPGSATSNAGTLTVGTALSITSQPLSTIVCAGSTTSYTVATTGTVISYQWQESTNGGGTWNTITNGGVYSGATTVTLTLTGVTAGMNNNQYRCVVTGSCPAINSSAATLTVNTAPNITSQPVSSIVCATQNTSFTTVATGTAATYQWQVSTTGCAGTFTNVVNGGVYTGATTATLTITGAPTTMNGYAYKCVISGTCTPAATSACVTLTVNTPVAITAQPLASVVCAGTTTTFGVTATGTSPTYQWQESTNGGGTWNNIANGGVYSGATTATLTLTGVTAGMTTYQYRCIVSGATSCGAVNSTAGILTVNTAPAITTQPVAGTTICAGQNTSYGVVANGTALTYQWQLSTDNGTTWNAITNGGVYSGATSATLSITAATVTMNTYRYRCVISGTCTPAVNSTASILTVYTPISITTPPAAATICATGTTSFSVVAAGTSPTLQWQESTNGGTTWSNITNGGIYSGATTATLTLTGVTAGMNGYLYRNVVSGLAPCGAVNTVSAALTVSAQPTVTLTASPYTKLLPGLTTTITASVTPPTGFTTVWTRNGVPISVVGNSVNVSVNELGLYTVVATIGSCISVPATITISDSASSKLFIYPSPNNGQFTVAYYNQGGSTTKQIVTIYSSKGERVYNNEFPVTQAYQLLKVDLRRNGSGVYYVVLSDSNGKVIKRGEVLVR
ncbi:T9SS type A sorting domain-containing protein [Ferruginibacter sp. SUN106]|uniref:T9SS type A sorting domain-containing protein n=1 Tax=Ferruginibacter sp. SUN106 TaxID=2978348 RepID=UPI003D3686CF